MSQQSPAFPILIASFALMMRHSAIYEIMHISVYIGVCCGCIILSLCTACETVKCTVININSEDYLININDKYNDYWRFE